MLQNKIIIVLFATIVSFWAIYKKNSITDNMTRTPVYFLSHGGPTFMYRSGGYGADTGAFDVTRRIGKHIRQTIKPKFIVMVSAHWQSKSSSAIEVAVPEASDENALIYDFYGFPKHMYEEKFRSKNDLSIATKITKDLNSFFSNAESSSLVHATLSKRGIDHGVWVPLKVAFPVDSPTDFNVDCPIIQVSLTADDTDFDTHYKLGQALSRYRDEGALVLVSGMSVHNLRDFMANAQDGKSLPYVKPFNDMIRTILTGNNGTDKLGQFKELLKNPAKRKILYAAHPTLEHFVPLIVGLGAGEGPSGRNDDDKLEVTELYNNETISLGWGIYRYGKL